MRRILWLQISEPALTKVKMNLKYSGSMRCSSRSSWRLSPITPCTADAATKLNNRALDTTPHHTKMVKQVQNLTCPA